MFGLDMVTTSWRW